MDSLAKPPLTFDQRLAAVEDAIDRHHVYLEGYLARLTRNHADAEDLISRLWVHVLRKFKDEQIGSLPLLRRKAYQLFVDHYRQRMRAGERIELREHLPEPALHHVGKEAYSSAEELELKTRFWLEFPADIPEQHREILWLSARYGFTIKEIADQLNLPLSTVGDWLLRAKQALADYINEN